MLSQKDNFDWASGRSLKRKELSWPIHPVYENLSSLNRSDSYDAVVVGAGPNGLAAAIRLAQERLRVMLIEANSTIGGGVRSAELTLPGFVHDLCSAIHPLAIGSPFFRTLPLDQYGLEWVQPEFPLAHPLDDGTAVVLKRSVEETGKGLGADAAAYRKLMGPMTARWRSLADEFLRPMLHFPRHPLELACFARRAVRSATGIAQGWFRDERAKALFAGLAAHSFLPLDQIPSSAFALVLGIFGHTVGWPMPRGGAQRLSQALASYFQALGGEMRTNTVINDLAQLPKTRLILLDVPPQQLLRIAGNRIPKSYREKLERYRCGPGVFKIDYALDAPIPWVAQECRSGGTIHLGGTLCEIAEAESTVSKGSHAESPFVLLAQPTLFDSSRASQNRHIAWAYTHVPNGSSFDMTERIEKQIERFAPGFKQHILARHVMNCADLESRNANLIGGDINGGAADLFQLLARPVLSFTPYRTPISGVYLCSASTPPGGGVHGMCGFHAATAALRDMNALKQARSETPS
jgi:phytoene dehydrogenase-like protein